MNLLKQTLLLLVGLQEGLTFRRTAVVLLSLLLANCGIVTAGSREKNYFVSTTGTLTPTGQALKDALKPSSMVFVPVR